MSFRQFLEIKFLDWQRETGGRKTVDQFAKHLGFGQSTLSMWWSGERKPQGENIRRLADKLGLEVYDALGLSRPDADLHYITQHWDDLPPETRRTIREQAEQYASQNETKRTPKTRRTTSS